MDARDNKTGVNIRFLQLTIALAIISLLPACATERTMRQQDIDTWVRVSVEALDTHAFFMTVPMFRTRTDSGTEIRNYAYGYDFEKCFRNAGAKKVGDFVNGNAFITCSSSRIVCNNLFYIKEGKVLEYVPRGRCYTDEKVQPETRYLRIKG